jgi:hypothetical protein
MTEFRAKKAVIYLPNYVEWESVIQNILRKSNECSIFRLPVSGQPSDAFAQHERPHLCADYWHARFTGLFPQLSLPSRQMLKRRMITLARVTLRDGPSFRVPSDESTSARARR